MLETNVAKVLQRLWLDLRDLTTWCEWAEHIYCVVRPEAIMHHPVNEGTLFELDENTFKICKVEMVSPSVGENWLMIYAHHIKHNVDAMKEEDWYDLYS